MTTKEAKIVLTGALIIVQGEVRQRVGPPDAPGSRPGANQAHRTLAALGAEGFGAEHVEQFRAFVETLLA